MPAALPSRTLKPFWIPVTPAALADDDLAGEACREGAALTQKRVAY